MGTFLKQSEVEGPKKKKVVAKEKRTADADPIKVAVSGPDDSGTPSMQHDINYVKGLGGIEESLDWIARGIASLVSDDHTVGLVHGQNRYCGPVQITLADEDGDSVTERLVTAIERIADSLGRLAGLNRPRLEPWHDQGSYTPPYRESACDGGAPGPATPDPPAH